jgi:hypothetical protein
MGLPGVLWSTGALPACLGRTVRFLTKVTKRCLPKPSTLKPEPCNLNHKP